MKRKSTGKDELTPLMAAALAEVCASRNAIVIDGRQAGALQRRGLVEYHPHWNLRNLGYVRATGRGIARNRLLQRAAQAAASSPEQS